MTKQMVNADRLWSKAKADGTGCWIWYAASDRKGYGRIAWNGRWPNAHRVAYELVKGPIPEGFEIDHLCWRPPCINPAHLEAVTPRQNWLRSQVSRGNSSKTHCIRGHEFTEENTYRYGSDLGRRSCRQCTRERQRGLYD